MIIAFNGNMGVGKSTAINVLKDDLALKTVVIKFAQPIYDMQEMIYRRISPVYDRPADFIKDRKLLQWLGTDWGRSTISESLWVDIWKSSAAKAIAAGYTVICDDVRFDNEAETIKSLNGTIINIVSNKSHDRINVNAGLKNHPSESGINEDFIDYRVENNGTLEDFSRVLNKIYKQILTPLKAQKLANSQGA